MIILLEHLKEIPKTTEVEKEVVKEVVEELELEGVQVAIWATVYEQDLEKTFLERLKTR